MKIAGQCHFNKISIYYCRFTDTQTFLRNRPITRDKLRNRLTKIYFRLSTKQIAAILLNFYTEYAHILFWNKIKYKNNVNIICKHFWEYKWPF